MIRRIINWIASVLAVTVLAAMAAGFFSTGGEATAVGVTFLFWTVAAGFALFGRLLDRAWRKLSGPCFILGIAAACAYLASNPSGLMARLAPAAENSRDWVGPLASWLNAEFGPAAVQVLFALATGFFLWLALGELRHQARRSNATEAKPRDV
jgi:hypothetical protein